MTLLWRTFSICLEFVYLWYTIRMAVFRWILYSSWLQVTFYCQSHKEAVISDAGHHSNHNNLRHVVAYAFVMLQSRTKWPWLLVEYRVFQNRNLFQWPFREGIGYPISCLTHHGHGIRVFKCVVNRVRTHLMSQPSVLQHKGVLLELY